MQTWNTPWALFWISFATVLDAFVSCCWFALLHSALGPKASNYIKIAIRQHKMHTFVMVLEVYLGSLGPSWGALVTSWGALGLSWCLLGPFWEPLNWDALATSWDTLRASWRPLGDLLGA